MPVTLETDSGLTRFKAWSCAAYHGAIKNRSTEEMACTPGFVKTPWALTP